MKIRYLLFPFSFFFGIITFIRRKLYKKGIIASYTPPLPVIGIGNLRVGGTGKTPHAEYIIRLLDSFRMGFISRGYGRRTKGYISVNQFVSGITPENIGDEPMQIHLKYPGVPMAVSEKRSLGIQNLINQYPDLDGIIMDDVYQHLQVSPGLMILLTEYGDPYFNDHLLPAGNLRESVSAAGDADIVLVTKTPSAITENEKSIFRQRLKLRPSQYCFFSTYIYKEPVPKNEKAFTTELSEDTPVILLTGIAKPDSLYHYLSTRYSDIRHFRFPDHHSFTLSDIEKIQHYIARQNWNNYLLVTTEKDYMRLSGFKKIISLLPVFVMEIEVHILDEEKKFNTLIQDYVRKNSKNSFFSE